MKINDFTLNRSRNDCGVTESWLLTLFALD